MAKLRLKDSAAEAELDYKARRQTVASAKDGGRDSAPPVFDRTNGEIKPLD